MLVKRESRLRKRYAFAIKSKVAICALAATLLSGCAADRVAPSPPLPLPYAQAPIAAAQSISAPDMSGPSGYRHALPARKGPYVKRGIVIASKKYPLPASYAPGAGEQAKRAMKAMKAAARRDGILLDDFSGYRSYSYQTTLYKGYVERNGKKAADTFSARPGFSEHQTGLAFDIGIQGRDDHRLKASFGKTKAGRWLAKRAPEFGFILRYPKGKERVTGFTYEPWHFRYLGKQNARAVVASGLTLDEYVETR